MPIYEYECNGCGSKHEFIQKFSDSPKRKCPSCGKSRLRKMVSAAAFHLKGNGWYVTDFRDKDKPKDTDKPKTVSKDSTTSESKDSKKTETSSETKASSKSSDSSSSSSSSSSSKDTGKKAKSSGDKTKKS